MRIDRYELFGPFATGGMASVHFGKLYASAGFQRIVAIKVPHAHVLGDPEYRSMFIDEARIVARIRNPHVVATLDIIEKGDVLYQVMEYANGPSLSSILKTVKLRDERVPIPIVLAIMSDTLEGLHAAHEATDDQGASLQVVHRDVSPQNILVTDAGAAQVIDFGIATAAGRLHLTEPGGVKGKASYMAPEQVQGKPLDRRADVYAVGIVLYEALTGERPFVADDFPATAMKHILEAPPDPRMLREEIPEALSAIVARALEKNPSDRFSTARSMADALIALPVARASAREVAVWLTDEASREFFVERQSRIAALSSIEEVRASIVPSVAAHLIEAPEIKTVTDTMSAAGLPRRSPGVRIALVGALAVLVSFMLVVLLMRRHSVTPGVTAATPAPPPLASASSASSMGSVAALPSPPSDPPSPPVSASPLVRKQVPGHPNANANANANANGNGNLKKTPPADATGTAGTGAVRPPCCAGDLRLRFSNCVDNCPAGL